MRRTRRMDALAVFPSTISASERYIGSIKERIARLDEQQRLNQEVREKMEKGVTDDAAL